MNEFEKLYTTHLDILEISLIFATIFFGFADRGTESTKKGIVDS